MKTIQVGPNSVHFTRFIKEVVARNITCAIVSDDHLSEVSSLGALHLGTFKSFNLLTLFREYRKLKGFLKKEQPQIVHVHQINRLAFFATRAARKLKIPVISTAWGSDVLLMPQKNKLNAALVRYVLKHSTYVTADAQSMIDAMQKIIPSEIKYKHIQYGIEVVKPAEKENIIFSNRFLTPLYRIAQIIEYFIPFSAKHPEWKLVIASTGSDEALLKSMVDVNSISDKVEFVGWLTKEENEFWYAKSKVYISIPSSDGTSVSVLEAMSAGCIPILSDLQVSKEWIIHLKNGILEQESINPFLELDKIDSNTLQQINFKLIEDKASKAKCMTKFIALYH